MRIQLISIVFPPDAVSTAQLLGEIADDLSSFGHDISVLTTSPHYNSDEQAARIQPITWNRSGILGQSRRGDVQIEHVRMSSKSGSVAGRVLQWLWFHVAVLGRVRASGPDAIFIVSPPPTLALAASLGFMGRKPRIVLAVWELYPDILVALGHLKPGLLLNALRQIERLTYKVVDHVAFISDAMRKKAIQNHDYLSNYSSVVPTFADTSQLHPVRRPSNLRIQLGLESSKVVGYGGNLGPAQDLTSLVEAARLLATSDPDIHFVLCGAGSLAEELREQAHDLANVHFTGQLPFEVVNDMYSTFDISVVPLAAGIDGEALPSKLYRSLACGVPVLAVATADSPLGVLVSTSGTGATASPGDAESLARTIVSMLDDGTLEAKSRAARQLAIDQFDRAAVTRTLEALLVES